MRTPSPPYCRLDLAPPLADRFIIGVAPIDYGPLLLLMPFGFHLAMDTLPSGVLATALRPARNYPRFRIWRPSSGRQRDFNPPEQRAAQHTSGRRRRACALASVRRSNCTDGFPVCSFHEDCLRADAIEGISPTRLTSPYSP